jgi:asparagine synthase (glutamine-hydrolysing)
MCGIVGIINQEKLFDSDRAFLQNASNLIAHRGPDAQNIWTNDRIGFGHRRLSIIDLASGDQPMHDITGRYTITFNGEIYNYKELQHFLLAKGYKFQTNSDTEVILNAYAHWGPACVEQFKGIFAFGLWDAQQRTVFLARDHLGVKPLLYYANHNYLIFASELKAILLHPTVQAQLDVFALSDYLSLGYILAPKTIIKNIKKLPPAMWLTWKEGTVHLQQYWDLAEIANQAPQQFSSEKAAIEELQGELERAVKTQLVSDVPVGAFLSGGIDSSTIVQKMVSLSNEPVQTFSMGFKEESFSELPYARLAANHLNTKLFEQIVSYDLELLPKLAWYFDEPFSDTSLLPTYRLCQLARQHVKVALSGDGGDECFAGYQTYLADKMQSLYGHIPSFIHHRLITPLIAALPSTQRKVSWDYKLKQFIKHAHATPEEGHYSWRLLFTEAEKQQLWGREIQSQIGDYTPFETFLDFYRQVPKASPLNRSLYVDTKTWLVDAMLVKVDRASMANGLEVRVPLLDYKLVEFAMSLPPHFKLRGWQTKAILKKAMASSLPHSVVYRSKKGFNAPVARWVEQFSQQISKHQSEVLPGLINMQTELLQQHKAHKADNGFKLWTLLMWSLWHQSVL